MSGNRRPEFPSPPDARVAAGDPLVILESMKMEIPIVATESGVVEEVVCTEGRAVAAGDAVCVLRVDP